MTVVVSAWSVASLLLAVGVWLDAHRLRLRYGGASGTSAELGAPGWALGVLLLPVIFLPAYGWKRARLTQRRTADAGVLDL